MGCVSAAVKELGFGDFVAANGVDAVFLDLHALAGEGAGVAGAVHFHFADELVAIDQGFADPATVDGGGLVELLCHLEEGGFALGDAFAVGAGHLHRFDVAGIVGVEVGHGLIELAFVAEGVEAIGDVIGGGPGEGIFHSGHSIPDLRYL